MIRRIFRASVAELPCAADTRAIQKKPSNKLKLSWRQVVGGGGGERARDRGDQEGGDRARSTLGLCGGAGTGLPAPGGGSGASNQAAGSRPSARPARAARPAD